MDARPYAVLARVAIHSTILCKSGRNCSLISQDALQLVSTCVNVVIAYNVKGTDCRIRQYCTWLGKVGHDG